MIKFKMGFPLFKFLELKFKKVHFLYPVNFLAAFLLFQIELIIAKMFLPKFGGSYLVWGSCVVFFQCVLLLGYLYSHLVVRNFGIFGYRYFHVAIIFLPLLFFIGKFPGGIVAHHNIPLVIDIFFQLAVNIGSVFFILSTISVISQSWLAASELPESSNPFVLYGISNIGSFLGLLSYPFIFEPLFDLDQQLRIWRFCYILFLIAYLIAFILIKIKFTEKVIQSKAQNLLFERFHFNDSVKQKLYWILLSASGATIFLSVTNVITYEIAPCPLLWAIPLAIYLASFALVFKENPFCPAWIIRNFHLVLGFSALLFFFIQRRIFPTMINILANLLSLFAICIYCQYKLYEDRPKEKSELTIFYLLISLGGVLGSLFVTWIAPLVFSATYEFLFGIFLMSFSLIIYVKRTPIEPKHLRLIFYTVLIIMLWPLALKGYNIFGIALILLLFKDIFSEFKTRPAATTLCLFLILCIAPFTNASWEQHGKTIHVKRNYYGIYKLSVEKGLMVLDNGTIIHGTQYLDKKRENEPIAYYHRNSPVGKLLESKDFLTEHNMGIVGLGAGSLAVYGKQGQQIDFFELDPDVYFLAKRFFTYLKNSKAKINYLFGDARISLMQVSPETYDLIIVDAFSGDSVPIHLLTVEAINEYKRCLKPKGILLFHTSNRYLDLKPVLFKNALAVKAFALWSDSEQEDSAKLASEWVALSWDEEQKEKLISKLDWKKDIPRKLTKPWTDKYSDIISILKLNNFLNSIKTFMPFYW